MGLLRGRGHVVKTALFRNHELEALPAWRRAVDETGSREASPWAGMPPLVAAFEDAFPGQM